MERIALLVVMLLALVLPVGGCARPENPISAAANGSAVRLKEPLDLGSVRLVYDNTDGAQWLDDDRGRAQMDLIEKAIQKQRNIRVELKVVYADRGSIAARAMAAKMCASGDPPEIVCRHDADAATEVETAPVPLRLNETIAQLGPNLAKIPQDLWENCKIGDSTVGIPRVDYDVGCFVMNKAALDQHGWRVPQTFEELDALLAEAKKAGFLPFVETPIWISFWYGMYWSESHLYPGKDGKLLPVYQTEQYLLYVDQLLQWKAEGFFDGTPRDEGFVKQYDNWLISYQALSQLGALGEVEVLPPLSAAGWQPAVNYGFSSGFWLESYHKPEALVTLADWSIASQENHDLMALGQKDVDYAMIGADGYDRTGFEKSPGQIGWVGQYAFDMPALYPFPMRNCADRENYDRAVDTMGKYLSRPDTVQLPEVSRRYAAPGSELWLAWKEMSFPHVFFNVNDYVSGGQSKEEYDARLQQIGDQLQRYVELTQKYVNGEYDPRRDMLRPN